MPRLRTVAVFALTSLLAVSQAFAGKRPSDEVRGRELYELHCQSCHGLAGRGDGPATRSLVKPVPDLKGVFDLEQVEDKLPVVLLGEGLMPGFEMSFDRYEGRRVLRYLAQILVTPPDPKPASPDRPPRRSEEDDDQDDAAGGGDN